MRRRRERDVREKDTQTEIDRCKTERDIDRQRRRETETYRRRQTERDRQKQTDRKRHKTERGIDIHRVKERDIE